MTAAIVAEDLRHAFGDVVALDGLELEVQAGCVLGLLGPNGAGKTTLVRILATLLTPTAGRASVLGRDVVAEPLAVRRRIGLAGQFAAVDAELTGRENVEMIARLYRLAEIEVLDESPGDAELALRARDRVVELLDRLAERLLGADRGVDASQLRALGLAQFAAGVAQAVALPTREKQALLEADSIQARLERLAGALDFHLALLGRAVADGPETVH